MQRIFCLWILTAAAASAQNAAPPASQSNLAPLEREAQQKGDEWNKLSQGLEASIARLLPCDANVLATIAGVSRASDARLAALAAYLQAASLEASRDTEAAARVLASE